MPAADPLDLDGELLAYACGASSVGVMDLAAGTRLEGGGASGKDVRIAGRYLAWVEPPWGYEPEIVVYDRVAGREAYRVDVKALLPPADFTYVDFDLRPDGRVVAGYNNYGSPRTLSWFSPEEPQAHVIAQGILSGPSVAGDLIAVKRLVPGADSEFAVIASPATPFRSSIATIPGTARAGSTPTAPC